MININDPPAYEKDGQGNFTQKGFLDRERDRAAITTLEAEVKDLDSTLSRSEIDLIVELRKLLVKIDNHAHESGTKPTGYSYQDFLINLAREANGHFGI